MTELTDTFAVVESGDEYPGDLLPTEQAELDREVTVEADATVEGGVYGEDVAVEGDVEGSILASNGVDVDGGAVAGEVGSSGRIRVAGARVEGGVTGTRVTIRDSLIFGDVVGEHVTLEDSLVVGIVVGATSLEARSSTSYTLTGHGETTLDGVSVMLPQLNTGESLTLETPVEVLGLPLDDDVELTESDVVDRDGERYLTLAPRLLDLEQVSEHLEELEAGLRRVLVDERNTSQSRGAVLESLGLA